MQKTVFHKTRYKDGKPVTDPKDKGGEEVHERYVLAAIDANDAVARFPKHYSFNHPGEGAKVVERAPPTPFNPQMVEVDEGSAPPPGAIPVSDSEAPNETERAQLRGNALMDQSDPSEREPLLGASSKKK